MPWTWQHFSPQPGSQVGAAAWGVRKIHAMLRRAPYELRASRKRVWALMKDMGLTFAPVGRPTGNSVTERVIRTMKEECIWLRDWNSIAELQAALDAWRIEYNERRPHQSLKWSTPSEVRGSHGALKLAA